MTEARAAAAHRIRRPIEAACDWIGRACATSTTSRYSETLKRRIETALHAYLTLEQRIVQVRAAAEHDINRIRQQQAIAVWQMSRAGRTVPQISELLEISQADAWQLLSAGRSAAAHATDDRVFHRTNPPNQQQPPALSSAASPIGHAGRQHRILREVDDLTTSTSATTAAQPTHLCYTAPTNFSHPTTRDENASPPLK